MSATYFIKYLEEFNGLVLYVIGGPSEITGRRLGSTEKEVRDELEGKVIPRLNAGLVEAA